MSELEHYQIIYDAQQVRDFLEKYIPLESESDLSISLMLFARRKYAPSLPRSEYILNRTFVAGGSTTDMAYRKLWRQHVPVGAYVDSNGKAVPNEALCVYAVLKPKNTLKALSVTVKECMDTMIDGGKTRDPYGLYIVNIAKSDSSSTQARYKYCQIDLDTKEPEHLAKTCQILEQCCVREHITSITETRGGFHIVYRKDKGIDSKTLHEFKGKTAFQKEAHDGRPVTDYWFSQTNQPLVIIPGTFQGGFRAKAWSVAEFFKVSK